MMRFIPYVMTCVFCMIHTWEVLGQEGYWQQFVHYTIDVTLDTEKKALEGKETILYRNNSPEVLEEIYLHLYPNAFKDDNSTVAQEYKADNYLPRVNPEDRGYIDIQQLQIVRRTENIDWESVGLSAYEIDDTILKAKLPDPLPPGGELMIEIKFYEKIRRILGRAGYRGNQFDFAQWYPKLVVYDEKGWNPEEVMRLRDGKVSLRIESDLERYGDIWFPKEVRYYWKEGTLDDVVKVTKLEVNSPDHPKRLTLADIGVEPSMSERDLTKGGGVQYAADVRTWDGERMLTSREWREKLARGDVQRGPKITAIYQQLKQGTYRRPDEDLRIQYNVKRQLTKGTVSEWEKYVRAFADKYTLNDDQRQKAFQVLRGCQERATAYALRHKEEHARKDLDERRRAKLMAPIGEIFEKQLKPRLERLPTRAQREAAEEREKAQGKKKEGG